MPQTIFVQMDVQVITWLQNEATTLFADRKSAEKVKVPSIAARKSLPKRRKTGEKGRDSCSRRLEISTQTWKKREKGRESHSRRPEISTQTAGIGRKGRDSQSRRPEISTQIAKICRKGRESQSRRLEISTQKGKNRSKR